MAKPQINLLGCIARSVTCLTADPGVESLIPVWSHTFVEIDHEIISTAIILPSVDSRKVVRKGVHDILVNWLDKSVVRLTDHHSMTIADD